jgi:SSS family transporter
MDIVSDVDGAAGLIPHYTAAGIGLDAGMLLGMNAFDYAIVAVFCAAMLGFAIHYRHHTAAADYFLGDRAFGWFPLCMSSMATQLSIVSFVSAPAFVGLRAGGGMQWLTYEFGVPLAMIVVMTVIGPALHRTGMPTVYSFLEGRFGAASRLLVGGLFILNRSFSTGITLYVAGLMLSSILRLQVWETMTILSAVATVYSLIGGMKAIVYAEVVQMIVKLLGILTIAAVALHDVGGWHAFVGNLDRSRLRVVSFADFGFDGHEFGFWPMLVGGIFLYASYYGTDQTQAQRLLAARDQATLRRILLYNGLLRFPVAFAYCLTGLILAVAVLRNPEFSSRIPRQQPDLLIPVFVSSYLPHGLIGIITVALIAAWMSTYSSTLNSLTAVTMEDFVGRIVSVPKHRYVSRSRSVLLGWGLLMMIQGYFCARIAATAIEAINKIGSLFYGPILGMFLLAALPSVGAAAANIAVLAGTGVNLVLWLFFKNVFWFWWNAFGSATTLAIGVLLSQIRTEGRSTRARGLMIPVAFPWTEACLLLAFFLCMLSFCLLLPQLL